MKSINLTATAWSTPNIYADKFDGVLKPTFLDDLFS